MSVSLNVCEHSSGVNMDRLFEFVFVSQMSAVCQTDVLCFVEVHVMSIMSPGFILILEWRSSHVSHSHRPRDVWCVMNGGTE